MMWCAEDARVICVARSHVPTTRCYKYADRRMPVTGCAPLCVGLLSAAGGLVMVHAVVDVANERHLKRTTRCRHSAHVTFIGSPVVFFSSSYLRLSRKHFLHSTRCAHGNVCIHARLDTQMRHPRPQRAHIMVNMIVQ